MERCVRLGRDPFVFQCLDFCKRPLNRRIFGGRLLKVPVLFVFLKNLIFRLVSTGPPGAQLSDPELRILEDNYIIKCTNCR